MSRICVLLVVALLAGCASEPDASESASASLPSTSQHATEAPSATPTQVPSVSPTPGEPTFAVETYPVPAGSQPHDVAPAADGGVWYTA